jgi:hypothetical protein
MTPCSWELSVPPAPAAFVLRLLFDPEDGGDMFSRNVFELHGGTTKQATLLEYCDELQLS